MGRWNPWDELRRHPDVEVLVGPCPLPGLYVPDRAAIVVATGQTRAMRRSALAEELGHHALRHRPHPDPVETARLEARAQRWADVRLVGLDDLAAALVGATSWHDVAEHLDVDELVARRRVERLTPEERRLLRRLVGRRELGL